MELLLLKRQPAFQIGSLFLAVLRVLILHQIRQISSISLACFRWCLIIRFNL